MPTTVMVTSAVLVVSLVSLAVAVYVPAAAAVNAAVVPEVSPPVRMRPGSSSQVIGSPARFLLSASVAVMVICAAAPVSTAAIVGVTAIAVISASETRMVTALFALGF